MNTCHEKEDKEYRGVLDALASLGSMLESESVINVFEILSYLGHILAMSWGYLGHISGTFGTLWAYLGHTLDISWAYLRRILDIS